MTAESGNIPWSQMTAAVTYTFIYHQTRAQCEAIAREKAAERAPCLWFSRDLSWPDSYWIINCPCQMSAQCVKSNQTSKSDLNICHCTHVHLMSLCGPTFTTVQQVKAKTCKWALRYLGATYVFTTGSYSRLCKQERYVVGLYMVTIILLCNM